MRIEIQEVSRNLEEIASRIGGYVQGDVIKLPTVIGEGYFRQFTFSEQLRMVIVNCSFKQDFTFVKSALPVDEQNRFLTLGFRNVFANSGKTGFTSNMSPSVSVASDDLEINVSFEAGVPIQCVFIAISIVHFQELLQIEQNEESHHYFDFLKTHKPFRIEEFMTPEISQVIADLDTAQKTHNRITDALFHRIKAEQLIYFFIMGLLKRGAVKKGSLNNRDVAAVINVRDSITKDLSIVPVLADLARKAGMSESKLKVLFKQVFGQSIYNYFQHVRIHAAAVLLLGNELTVSDVGYRVGFTNLSHFTRLFKKQTGKNPKQFQKDNLVGAIGR